MPYSPSMVKPELVKRTGEKTSGAALHTSQSAWVEINLGNSMDRVNRKSET